MNFMACKKMNQLVVPVWMLCSVTFLCLVNDALKAKSIDVVSPNQKLKAKIDINAKLTWSLSYNNRILINPSPISLTLENRILGINPVLEDSHHVTKNENIYPVIPEKRNKIVNHYKEAILEFKGNYGLVIRVYDDGFAYRFFTKIKGNIDIFAEQASFIFPENWDIYFPFDKGFITHQEQNYSLTSIVNVSSDSIGYPPVVITPPDGPLLAITEADLEDYPGLSLSGSSDGSPNLYGKFPAYPLREKMVSDRDSKVIQRAAYLARTWGDRQFPWRVVAVAENDGDLIENDLIYRLAKPLQIKDTSWIKPGKVAWDWWNANNVWDVPFKAGINTDTYKYYIDFASDNNIPYIILDEGWSDPDDLLSINPDLDMEALFVHARQKKVGIILWCLWHPLEEKLEQALDLFEKWGVKGLKVDFMQRDDQRMVNYYHKIARETAKRKMLLDFHGAYKPTGLRRAFPNLITREGVRGLEWNKWSETETPEHDLRIPFIRMLAGPMDFTPGAMMNAQKENFRAIFERPMSQGTRVHQLAMYVVYESPLQMLADTPSHYKQEPEMMEFLSDVPVTWDETRVLKAKISDYLLMVRKKGDDWYIAAMTDWTPRTLDLDCSFLPPGTWNATIYKDGINADRYASDYEIFKTQQTQDDQLSIEMAAGGGWVAKMSP